MASTDPIPFATKNEVSNFFSTVANSRVVLKKATMKLARSIADSVDDLCHKVARAYCVLRVDSAHVTVELITLPALDDPNRSTIAQVKLT